MAPAPLSPARDRDDDDDDAGGDAEGPAPLAHVFATETMAELSVRQGRTGDAVAIYRHLLGGLNGAAPDDERRRRWTERLATLEQAPPSGTARAAKVNVSPVSRVSGAARPAPQAAATGARSPAAEPVTASAHRLPLVIRQPVRSGQIVYAEKGDLIVMAPVNPGAQVIADGNIHVYAALRGRAVAGVRGAADAQVFCLALEAELIGVDVGYVPSADIPPALWGKPSRAFLRDGVCVIEPLAAATTTTTTTTTAPATARAAGATGGWSWRRKPA
ncbi:MAG: septum site-determining protein MinC [Pseudomonadota bacterium]